MKNSKLLLPLVLILYINMNGLLGEKEPIEIKIKQVPKYIYGDVIEFFIDIKNLCADKSMMIDTQPYYLLANGTLKNESPKLLYVVNYEGNYSTVNHVYINEGDLKEDFIYPQWDWKYPIFYSTSEIPYSVIIKPNNIIRTIVHLEPRIYCSYFKKGKWSVEFHVGWKYTDKINMNYIIVADKNGNIIEKNAKKLPLLSIPIINNFSPGSKDWPCDEEQRIKYYNRKPFYQFAISNKITLIVE